MAELQPFQSGLVSDAYAGALVRQAVREHLVSHPNEEERFVSQLTCSRVRRHDALAMLVLFEQVVLPVTESEEPFRVPSLEEEGALHIVPGMPREFGMMGPPPELSARGKDVMRMAVHFVQDHRELVVTALLRERQFNYVAKCLRGLAGLKPVAALNMCLDVVNARIHGECPTEPLDNYPLELAKALYEEYKYGDPGHWLTNLCNGAFWYAAHLYIASRLSLETKAGIATHIFAGLGSKMTPTTDPLVAAKQFTLVRVALNEEGAFFPHLSSINDAISLRHDPHLAAFRRQLRVFIEAAAAGNPVDLAAARIEVRKARQAIERTRSWQRPLKWITYVSLPVSVAETLLHGLPVISLPLGALSVTATASVERLMNKHQWVLFGDH